MFERQISLGDDMNRQYMRDLRLYMLVGGMPQAVSEYLNTKNLRAVDSVKRKIIKLYIDDFRKKFSSRVGNRYLVYTKDLRKDGATMLVPVYMAGLL